MPNNRAYAEGVSLVDKNKTAHPRRLRAKIVTTVSKLDGASMATTGAFSNVGSYDFVSHMIFANENVTCVPTAGSSPFSM